MLAMANTEEKRKVVFIQPIYATIIQVISVLGTLAVFIIMFLQLTDIRHEQAISLRPYLQPRIDEVPGTLSLYELRNPGQENEMWGLGYFIENVGKYPAKNVYFKAEWGQIAQMVEASTLDNEKPLMVNPGTKVLAIVKDLPRSEVIRIQKGGGRIYRHFYIKYEDNDGTAYHCSATWILSDYEVGSRITWRLVTNDGN
jgi:hypothetical protein